MGSFSHLTISEFPIFDSKNGWFTDVASSIFLPDDYFEEKRTQKSRNKLIWGDTYSNEKGYYIFKGFKQPVKVCKKRLEIYGMNLKKSINDFNRAKKKAEDSSLTFPLFKVKFEEYQNTIKDIVASKYKKYGLGYDTYHNFKDYIAENDFYIEGQSVLEGFYAILDAIEDDEIVEYDLTEVIAGGWVSKNPGAEIGFEKIIVLTEGKTDTEFISNSLKILYPHLYNYYHFIDFEGYKVEGSASALVKLVKAFIAANVKHPIIAVFDNDTTGIMEMSRINTKTLPENIKVIKLPDIQLAKSYPTIGPTGIKKMNINGLACGIEMYLGQDLLITNNTFTPIRWREYNDSTKKYHGVIENKENVQKRFRDKLKKGMVDTMDEMKIILETLFTTFH